MPILVYHYVEYPSDPNDTIRRSLTVLPVNLDREIKTLLDGGYRIITLEDLYLAIYNKEDIPEKSVIVTFDDGYRDFYTDAFPIVEKYKIPVTVFVPTGLINHPNYLTYAQIKEIIQSKFKEILQEVSYSKKFFEDTYGVKMKYFAYPYGAYNNKVGKYIKDAGFILAASMVGDGTHKDSESTLYHLPRLKMGNATVTTFFK